MKNQYQSFYLIDVNQIQTLKNRSKPICPSEFQAGIKEGK